MLACVAFARSKLGWDGGPECEREKTLARVYVRLLPSHFSVMTKDTAVVLTGGPELVERATGKRVSKEELGGAKVHTRSGVVDNVAESEDDALRQIQRFLSYLPPSVHEPAPRARCDDPAEVTRRLRERQGREREPPHEASDVSVFHDISRRWRDPAEDRLPDGRAPTVITYETRTGAVSVRAGAPAGELDRVLATLRQGPPSPGVRGRGAEGDGQAIDRGT